MHTLVIGKTGQVAQALASLDKNIICLGRHDIDITDLAAMSSTLDNYQIESIINASAYTAVDLAESNEAEAYLLNSNGVQNLAQYSAENTIHLVHISTDYVFSGDKGKPYLVDDPISPVGVYGASKAAGERAINELNSNSSCIIRTSWVYSPTGNNFVKTMLRLMKEKPQLGIIDDQIGSPTSAHALAEACLLASRNKILGTHHFTDSGVCSWFDFALAIQEFGIKYGLLSTMIPVNPIATSAYPTPAKRPSYSVLDKASLSTDFNGLQPRHWRVEVESVIKELAR